MLPTAEKRKQRAMTANDRYLEVLECFASAHAQVQLLVEGLGTDGQLKETTGGKFTIRGRDSARKDVQEFVPRGEEIMRQVKATGGGRSSGIMHTWWSELCDVLEQLVLALEDQGAAAS